MKQLFIIILAILNSFLLTSCVLTESEMKELFTLNTVPPSVKVPFKKGDVLSWDTGFGKGTMMILSLNEGKFEIEQFNQMNINAGLVHISGEIFADGTCVIQNPSWNEVWTGNINGNTIIGKVNDSQNFRIEWNVPSYMSHTTKTISKLPFRSGDVLKWQAANTRGTMKVISQDKDSFVLEKYNDFEKRKAPVRISGSLFKDGKCIMQDKSGKLRWSGKLDSNVIIGRTNEGYNFKISRSNSVWDMPFKRGDTLNWKYSYKKGTFKVDSVSTGGKFTLDLYTSASSRYKQATLYGEILADGTYKIVNDKTMEMWIGNRNAGEIKGKVNNKYDFVISNLK